VRRRNRRRPQFVDVGRGHVASQIAVLGVLLIGLGFTAAFAGNQRK
jgi:threonine/homoserine/homoserine lactone efflux protein